MKKTFIAALVSGGLIFAACSADKTDFKAAAQKTIRKDVEDNSGIEGDATVECDDPDSTDKGTTFDCVATAGDGTAFNYSAEITGDKEVTVNFVP
ncbi:MAG: DUF4333 domain-containing protein [Ilumatobacteraceae bacterium]